MGPWTKRCFRATNRYAVASIVDTNCKCSGRLNARRRSKKWALRELEWSAAGLDFAPCWTWNGSQIRTQDSDLLKASEPYGSTNVLIRFGSSWVGMRATSLSVFVSIADTVFSAELVT